MEQDIKGFGDYVAVLNRRKARFIVPAALILVLSAAVAFLLPPAYRSSATILIEQQEIPSDLVRSTVTSYADQRIQLISQRVMTSANLQRIVEKFGLYAEELETESMLTVLEEMREDIGLEMINADVVDPAKGKAVQATIAFTLSYVNESPLLAQKVANELVTLFLNENLKQRSELASETSSFLTGEAEKLKKRIGVLEAALAEFKEKNINRLPELMQLNLQLMERTERELTEVRRQIRSLEERRIYLNAELAQLSPNSMLYSADGGRIFSPEDRLKDLRARYTTAAATYSENHPDLVKMRKEIAALEKEVQSDEVALEFQTRLKDLNARLVGLRERYSAPHPDVKKVQRTINSVQQALQRELARERPAKAAAPKPDNPAYIQLQAQLDAAESDLASYRNTEAELRARLDDYEKRITGAPQVEREYKNLTRDYENALAKYQEIKAKQMQAELAETLEKENKGEQFSLIEPPQLPEEPEKPNRLAILFLGFIFSMAGGIGTVAVSEAMDDSIHGARGVVEAVGMPPLAVIPYITNRADHRRNLARRLFRSLLFLAVIGGGAALIHFFFMPLDVLWFSILRRLQAWS